MPCTLEVWSWKRESGLQSSLGKNKNRKKEDMTYKFEFTGSVIIRADDLADAARKFFSDPEAASCLDYRQLKVVECPLPKRSLVNETERLLANGHEVTL